MGGMGSGSYWNCVRTRPLVETCTSLDTAKVFTREIRSLLRNQARVDLTVTWKTRSFPLVLRQLDSGLITLDILLACCQRFAVVKVSLTFGHRYYLLCKCGRQCVKVYLPPGENFFKCRDCYRLTYSSCNVSRSQLYRALAHIYRSGRWIHSRS